MLLHAALAALAALNWTGEELAAGVHALGAADARRRLLNAASTRGLTAVVVGGSISVEFAGGRRLHQTAPEKDGAEGFVGRWLRHVRARFPAQNHTLLNRARSGNGPRHMRPCVRSFVPLRTDVVFLDYAVNGGRPEDIEHLRRVWRTYPGGGPLLVLLNNFYWCRDERGEHALEAARRGCAGGAAGACRQKAMAAHCLVPNNGARLLNATRCWEAALEASLAPCGAAALSVFDLLGPKVRAGEIRSTSEIAPDGYHPRGHQTPLVEAWGALLVHWFDAATAEPLQPRAPEALLGGQHAGQRAVLARMVSACAERPPPISPMDSPKLWAHLAASGGLCRVWETGTTRGTFWRNSSCYSLDGRILPEVQVLNATGWSLVETDGGKPRPGYVSHARGDVLRVRMPAEEGPGGARLPVRRAAVSLLHSYEHAGTVRLGCAGSCACAELVHSTRWRKLSSGEVNVELAVSRRGGTPRGQDDECVLVLTNEHDEKVKFTGLAVERRRR